MVFLEKESTVHIYSSTWFRFKLLKMMLLLYLTRRSNIEGFVDDIGEWCLVHLGSICCFRRKGEMALQESFLTINKMHKTDIIRENAISA